MTEQEYKQKIDQAFEAKKWGDVIFYENDFIELVYEGLAKQEGVTKKQAIYDLPREKFFAYFQAHDLAPILTKKGIAAINMGDFNLARQTLETAISSLRPDSTFADPYFYLAYLAYSENQTDIGTKTLCEGQQRNPKLLDNFDQIYDPYLAPISLPEAKEKFKVFCREALKS